MHRPLHTTIDLAALRHNLGIARQHAEGAGIWAVLKANAYGHGLPRCAEALADSLGETGGYALIELESAIALRQSGLRQPILLLEGFYAADELPLLAEYRLTPVLHSLEQVQAFVAARLPARLPVYLKLNTGMNRLGLNAGELPQALRLLETAPHIDGITLMTHFSDADSGPAGPGIVGQMRRLAAQIDQIDRAGQPAWPLCLANSAALLRYPETIRAAQGGWVRPGIMLYGSSPFPEQQTAAELGLRPVMTLTSELIAVRDITAGERVGYGGAFTAERDMRIGIVACGYGDGYPRHAPTGTPVLVDGQRTRLLGRVSMDKICVDLTGIPQAAIGTPVILWGEGLSVDEIAMAAGTVSYELLCALTTRVPVVEIG
ncbi:alanine racemase 2, PLP-binding [Sterolibacterium denitrificans]|uniref:Alanine racemase n=1 Tax=Sterolibacterium denitrificans TaxID=157592 RepID=A0A7Z7HQR9_9PROT|nr:alanine racemase [Sterolibacterium denitrificans]SMB25816.1 alanine racemase 2, PLP-binding [Sterolibacterium denitrificans]